MATVDLTKEQLCVFVEALKTICGQVIKGQSGELTVDGFKLTWRKEGLRMVTKEN